MRNYLFIKSINQKLGLLTVFAFVLMFIGYPAFSQQDYWYLGPILSSGTANSLTTVNDNVGFTTNMNAVPTAAIKTTEYFSS